MVTIAAPVLFINVFICFSPHKLRQPYHHKKGITLYFTFLLYSAYPAKPSSRTFSSLRILFEIIAGYIRKITKEIKEPSTNGMDRNRKIVALYMGWRTMPYRPVSMTV